MRNRNRFNRLRRGTIFTLPHEGGQQYVKLGEHGARAMDQGRINQDHHCIPARYDVCEIKGHIND